VRLLYTVLAAVSIVAGTATSFAHSRTELAAAAPLSNCSARDASSGVEWHTSDESETAELTRWCRAVGGPVVAAALPSTITPVLDELVVLSWNAHLSEGDLDGLIARLRSGALTSGRPVRHFVLLVQELYRRGDEVPAFNADDRSAFAIRSRERDAADIDDHAAALGLSIFYVPSMRNGAQLREDRGNAIISTEPLLDPFALELPLARQRRVALGAGVLVNTGAGPRRLEVVDAHLEPLSSPASLWIFKNPRGRQVRAILDLLERPRFTDPSLTAGVVLGGDFNTIKGGAREDAYRLARSWSSGLKREDARNTHMMGRLDYLFFKLPNGWSADTRRLEERFGSDHYPVMGTISAERPVSVSTR
jgi:endonuclease/exonuclease/phosphatase family metal-dependent hydrolase